MVLMADNFFIWELLEASLKFYDQDKWLTFIICKH